MSRQPAPRTKRLPRVAGDALLNIAALGGVVCIVLVALAFLFNITLIMFKTGSMSPTIPAGSVAVVREIPASEIQIGDVVTVDRGDKLPITHRVTSIEPGTGETRTFTMRGDANKVDDVEPYTASTVRIVMLSVPGFAPIIVWFSNPWILGGITLAASALVTWAFWPRDRADDVDDERDEGDEGDGSAGPRTSRRSVPVGVALGLIAVASGTLFVPAVPAHAAETETIIRGSVLTLTAIGDTQLMSQLRPGSTAVWQVGVTADAPEPGVVTISLSALGDLVSPTAFDVSIDSCTERWQSGTCSGSEESLLAQQPLADALLPLAEDGTRLLTTSPSSQQRWLLVKVGLTTEPEPGLSTTLQIHASGLGDDVVTDGPPILPPTGADASMPIRLALTAIAAGLVAAWLARVRRRVRS